MTGDASPPDAAALSGFVLAVGRNRDRAAFAALFVHFAPRLKTYLLRSGLPDGRAEDLAQETMLLVWRKAAMFDPGRASASTWIFTIARNLRADALRRDARPRAATAGGIGTIGDALDAIAATVPDTAGTAEERMAVAERDARLRSAVRALPADQARALEMSYFGDRSQTEIGRDLGVPLGTVKGRLRLALARLRAALREDAP